MKLWWVSSSISSMRMPVCRRTSTVAHDQNAASSSWVRLRLVCQELFAFLTVYQALCALEAEAARQAGIDPDRISFTVTVRVARDHAIITPRSLQLARRQALAD